MEISFPENMPVVLIGENNAGKSNIIRAINLMFGEFHPKYKGLEDYDHYKRDPRRTVNIEADVSGFQGRLGRSREFSCTGFTYSRTKGSESTYEAIQEDGNTNQYVSNELRNEVSSILVSSEQDLSYQLSYTSKYTLLSKVTRKFHDRLSEDKEKVAALKLLYDQTVEIFLGVSEFSEFRGNMSAIAGQVFAGMSYALDIDFSAYDPSNYYKNLRVLPTEEGTTRSFEELGTGQQQILALAFAHAYSKSFSDGDLLLIIDEPEAHLHPIAQKWLAANLFEMAANGLQVVITTHSPHFINLDFMAGLYLISKGEDGSRAVNANASDLAAYCVKSGANPTKTLEKTIVPFYRASATSQILNGFFAKKIILVEGPTEELALPTYLAKVGLNLSQHGIELISVGGKGNLAKWHRFFGYYLIPTYVCFDNDSRNDNDGTKRKDAMKSIGIQDGDMEGLLTTENWNVGTGYCVFGQDFEKTFESSFNGYQDIQKKAKEVLGNSKPIVAREIATQLIVDDSIGWKKIAELSAKIQALN
jgi:putative ATP-dependent endonuclease of OLD family